MTGPNQPTDYIKFESEIFDDVICLKAPVQPQTGNMKYWFY